MCGNPHGARSSIDNRGRRHNKNVDQREMKTRSLTMKRWVVMFAAMGVLVGCSSTPKEEQKPAQVSEATPSQVKPTPPAPSGPSTAPVRQEAVSTDPLKDPNNILSRRSV